MENKIIVVGDEDWRGVRSLMINMLEGTKTENEFTNAIKAIVCSCGTLKDMQRTRKILGVKPFTPKEIKEMKNKQ